MGPHKYLPYLKDRWIYYTISHSYLFPLSSLERAAVIYSFGRGGGRKLGRRMNTVQKICTHACDCNEDTCCNYSMIGRSDEGEWWKG
jgi:hypothetical protein